ncbi:MAG: pyridoxal phosphate-dependent aminotransferase, partial [Armatimonadetes bacterium]|nr:pyridoxal phosphate-dependent aminotransferase [Armatimonadota bacterium]
MGVPPLAQRVIGLGGEAAFTVLAEVQALQRQGRDIVSFAIGELVFPTPEPIKEAAVEAIRGNMTRYAPSAGTLELREAAARAAGEQRGLTYSADEVVVTPGAKPILFYGLMALANAGDEVIYPTPCFPVYENIVQLLGAAPAPVLLREEHGFRFDVNEVADRITPRTRVLMLNSPGNPCGNVFTHEDLAALAELAVKYDLWVLSDEVYGRLVYDGEHVSIASLPGMRERTLIVDGHSKTFAMTGWRLGYGVGPREVIEAITCLVVNSVSCTAPFTQHAGAVGLAECLAVSEGMRAELQRRRDLVVDGLNELPGFTCRSPGGAFYAFANVTECCRRRGLAGDEALQRWLLHEVGVAALHRGCFGERLAGERE